MVIIGVLLVAFASTRIFFDLAMIRVSGGDEIQSDCVRNLQKRLTQMYEEIAALQKKNKNEANARRN